jgi:hypothetical protein
MAERERLLDADERIIDASPSKSFFIWMLTRDIGITDCILDLIDNPVDNVVEQHEVDVTEALVGGRVRRAPDTARVNIDVSAEGFSITDTCGGIGVDEAREHVFRFGYPDDKRAAQQGHGLSVYGVGMKRAFFKLGRIIRVDSLTKREHFELTFDVAKWAKTEEKPEEWHLEFDRVADVSGRDPKRLPGTSIRIETLTKAARRRFADPQFPEDLRRRIGTSHGLFLKAGIEISVNGRKALAEVPEVVNSTKLRPVRQTAKYDGVEILLIAGLTPKEDRIPRGWYVFCNGRMVIEADKTALTGWGDRFPAHHSKYNHFCGFVYFRSTDVNALPWTTTKQGVERESEVYQAALAQMRLSSRPILDYLNDLYPGDVEDLVVEQRDLLRNAPSVPVDRVPAHNREFSARVPKQLDSLMNIQYRRRKKDVDKIRQHLGDPKMPAYRVGEETFDYFLEHEIE